MHLLNASMVRQVPLLDVATLVPAGTSFAVTKIDVEGYEVHVLESLRSAWSLLGDIVMEVQPRAWKWQNISTEAGLDTFRQLIHTRGMRIVQLHHSGGEWQGGANKKPPSATPIPDVCSMPKLSGKAAITKSAIKAYKNLYTDFEIDFDAFRAVLLYMLHHPRKMGYFRDFMFTSRACSAT